MILKINEEEIKKIKIDEDNDLESICNINKFYKQINEVLIFLKEIEYNSDIEW